LSYSQSLSTTETVNSLRDAPENGSSTRVITVKWLLKNEKLTARLKNKTWTNPQIKNLKTSLELSLIRL